MRCPRCQREVPEPTAFCRGCGAPLLLAEEASPRPLDEPVDLDRRGRGPGEAEAGVRGVRAAPPAPRERPAALDRSHWDLGRAAPSVPEPVPGPPPAPGPADAALPDAEVDALEVHVQRAAGWRRAAAWAVDALPFAAAGVALGRTFVHEAAGLPAPASGLDGLLDLVARERVIALSVTATVTVALAVYATLAHALMGATLGKRLFGLRVVGPDGAPPSPARSAVRSALAILSAALVGLGFLLALFTRSGRALHDVIARTWVVKAP